MKMHVMSSYCRHSLLSSKYERDIRLHTKVKIISHGASSIYFLVLHKGMCGQGMTARFSIYIVYDSFSLLIIYFRGGRG